MSLIDYHPVYEQIKIKNIMLAVPGIISAMAKYEKTKTWGNYFKILDEVEKMENVNFIQINMNTNRSYFIRFSALQTALNSAKDQS